MNGRRWLLATTILATVATVGQAQGRGRGGPPATPPTPPAGRGQVITQEQRTQIQKLREQQRKEMLDLRAKQRDQFEKALPPAARERMAQRQQQLLREGRQFEQMRRGRGGRAGVGMGQACMRGPQPGAMGMRGRGGRAGAGGPPAAGGRAGRGRGGIGQQGAGPRGGMGQGGMGQGGMGQGGMGQDCLNGGRPMQNQMGPQNGMGPGRGGMRGRGGMQPPPPPDGQ